MVVEVTMSAQLLEAFLCDVFDIFSIGEIEDITSIIDFEQQTLVYNALYEHPRIKTAACFALCWKHIFDVLPSRYDVWDFLNMLKTKHIEYQTANADHALQYMTHHTFIKYVASHEIILPRITRLSWQLPVDLHTFLKQKIAFRYGKYYIELGHAPDRLMQFYKHVTNDIDFIKEAQKITHKQLLTWNPITDFYVDTSRSHHIVMGPCSSLDCTRHVIAHDNHMNYKIFDKVAVFNVKAEHPAPFWCASQVHMVFKEEHRTLVDFCVPNWFNTAVMLYPAAGMTRALGTKKNLIIASPSYVSSVFGGADVRILRDSIDSGKTEYVFPWDADTSIAKSLFALHLKHDSPFATANKSTTNNALYAWDRITRLYLKVKDRCAPRNTPPPSPAHTLVLVDNRANIFSVMAIMITLANLKPDVWDTHVVTRAAHVDWYKQRLPFAHVSTDPRLEDEPFHIETYNVVLKDNAFWKQFIKYKRVLIVQDDGMIVRKGLEQKFIQYDYVGAPWIHNDMNQELILMNKGLLVGNGGLSLRNPTVMADICARFGKEAKKLFNDQLQPIPEDVFFSHCIAVKLGGKVATPSNYEASHFAIEQVYTARALGFHKFWNYMPLNVVEAFFDEVLQ